MFLLRLLSLLCLLFLSQVSSAQEESATAQPEAVPETCPVTRPPDDPFLPPAPYPTDLRENDFWLGTEKLWIPLHYPEVWKWAPHQPGHEQEVQPLTEKVFWWRVGYDVHAEPRPNLKVTGRRLDGPAPPLMVMPATNAYTGTWSMLTGVYAPAPGCWEITGDYQGDKLSFIVWVEPAK
jgi:hypothetical protein